MIEYLKSSSDDLWRAWAEHFQIVGTVLLLSILLAGIIVWLAAVWQKKTNRLVYLFSIFYSIPSYALFALLIPFTGLGFVSAVIVLIIYCQYILLRSFSNAINEVNPALVETAYGMGMTANQVFYKIQLPLAIGPIIGGIKIAATSTIGIATIAATINAGGIGRILFDGLRTSSLPKLLWGTLLAALMCLFFNFILELIKKIVKPKVY